MAKENNQDLAVLKSIALSLRQLVQIHKKQVEFETGSVIDLFNKKVQGGPKNVKNTKAKA